MNTKLHQTMELDWMSAYHDHMYARCPYADSHARYHIQTLYADYHTLSYLCRFSPPHTCGISMQILTRYHMQILTLSSGILRRKHSLPQHSQPARFPLLMEDKPLLFCWGSVFRSVGTQTYKLKLGSIYIIVISTLISLIVLNGRSHTLAAN